MSVKPRSPERPAGPEASSPFRAVLAGRRRLLAASFGLAATWQAAEAMVPVVVGLVIDRAITNSDIGSLIAWFVVLAAMFTVLTSCMRFGGRLNERASQYGGLNLRLSVARRILHPGGGAAAGRRPGELLSIASADVSQAASITEAVGGLLIVTTGVGVAAVFLLSASLLIGLVVLAGLPFVLLGLNLMTRALERRSATEQELAAQATAMAVDVVSGLRVLQGLQAEPAATSRYREASRASLQARVRATRLLAIQSGVTLMATNGFLALVALLGGRLAAQGRISIGELVAAVGLTQYLIGPLTWLGLILAGVAQSRASGRRVAALLDAPLAVTGGLGTLCTEAAGSLRIDTMSHGPLRRLHLDVAAGELVAIAVADPAVAKSLLDCLAREIAPEAGTICLDGTDVAALELDAVRKAMLVAPHDADLFEDTIPANVDITAANPDRSRASISAAAADQVIAAVPADSVLTEWARSLSGGQRQRVALARALAADPAVLVLHDPTTAVDAVTESRIAQGIRRVRAGRTTVLVTTSPPLLAVTDRVVLLVDGVVAEEGAHAELLRSSPGYREAVLG
ncbi:MAG: ABC transporter ATP-binding protein [Pseudonocardiaceae bacterium]